MKRLGFGLGLILLIIIGIGQPLKAAETPFSIEAEDQLIIDQHQQLVRASGQVVVKFDKARLQADQVRAYLDKQLIIAEGSVVLVEDGHQMTGTRLEYNYETERGSFATSRVEEPKLTFTGEEIDIRPDNLKVESGFLTPCTYDKPHYSVTADRIMVYPGDELVATGVWFWIKDVRLFPLFTYRMKLSSREEQELQPKEEQRASFPEWGVGYNKEDGVYGELNYHHYLGSDSAGNLYLKAASRETHRFKLNYDLVPNQYFTFSPGVDYDHQYGWDYTAALKNEYLNNTSNLRYSSFIEQDEDNDHYRERKWTASWNLATEWRGLAAEVNLEREPALEGVDPGIYRHLNLNYQLSGFEAGLDLEREATPAGAEAKDLKQELFVRQDWSDYYWQLEGSRNSDLDYQPQLILGLTEKQLGDYNQLSGELRTGRIFEAETGVETDRHALNLNLVQSVDLTDRTSLNAQENLVYSRYETGDRYQTRDLRLDLRQEYPWLAIGLDYQYYNELGASPFQFDDSSDGLGRRQTVGLTLGKDQFQLSNSLAVDWSLYRQDTYYQSTDNLARYGGRLGLDYRFNKDHQLAVDYNYHQLMDAVPVDEAQPEDQADKIRFISQEDLTPASELTGSYSFGVESSDLPDRNRTEWDGPYWNGQLSASYDFAKQELTGLEFSLSREYDCFNLKLNLDQMENKYNFEINFKY